MPRWASREEERCPRPRRRRRGPRRSIPSRAPCWRPVRATCFVRAGSVRTRTRVTARSFLAYHVSSGRVQGVPTSRGSRSWRSATSRATSWPGTGRSLLLVDDKATPEQKDGLVAALGGAGWGPPRRSGAAVRHREGRREHGVPPRGERRLRAPRSPACWNRRWSRTRSRWRGDDAAGFRLLDGARLARLGLQGDENWLTLPAVRHGVGVREPQRDPVRVEDRVRRVIRNDHRSGECRADSARAVGGGIGGGMGRRDRRAGNSGRRRSSTTTRDRARAAADVGDGRAVRPGSVAADDRRDDAAIQPAHDPHVPRRSVFHRREAVRDARLTFARCWRAGGGRGRPCGRRWARWRSSATWACTGWCTTGGHGLGAHQYVIAGSTLVPGGRVPVL